MPYHLMPSSHAVAAHDIKARGRDVLAGYVDGSVGYAVVVLDDFDGYIIFVAVSVFVYIQHARNSVFLVTKHSM